MASITSSSLFDICVYIRVDERELVKAEDKGGLSIFESGKSWTGAEKLMAEAGRIGKTVPVLFSDAAASNDVIYWALLEDLKITQRVEKKYTTQYTVSNLHRLGKRRKLSELVIESTGNNITPGRKAGYIFCSTPEFLKRELKKLE